MEPPYKRPRFYGPVESNPFPSCDSDSSLNLYEQSNFLYAEKGEMEERIDTRAVPDHQNDVEQKRARLDYKLKSTFEAIFEKYSRDFTGIGDEIDLRTGEIVVNNGHLLKMEDEKDAGTPSNILLEPFMEDSVCKLGSNESENNEFDGIDHSYVAPEDMEEDDMIFFQGSRIIEGNPTVSPPKPSFYSFSQQQADLSTTKPQAQHPHLKDSRLVANFGERSVPQISRYVVQKQDQDGSNIEAAWRTPSIPLATTGRPVLKSILIDTDIERSPSPSGSSVWAPSMPRGRRRRDGADLAALFKGEITVGDRERYSSGVSPTAVTQKTAKRAESSPPVQKMSVIMKNANSTETTLPVSLPKRGDVVRASTSYSMMAVSDSEKESSDGASTYYDTGHLHSDSEMNYDYGWSKQSEQKASPAHRLRVASCESSHFENGLKMETAPKVLLTPADSDTTIDCTEKAQRHDFNPWPMKPWRIVAERNPRNGHMFWQSIQIGKNAINSARQIPQTEHAHMNASHAHTPKEDDNTLTSVRDPSQPITSSTRINSGKSLSSIAFKPHLDLNEALGIGFRSMESSPINEIVSGAVDLSVQADPGPSYCFSDEDEDSNHDGENSRNLATGFDVEPHCGTDLQEQHFAEKKIAREVPPLDTKVLEEQTITTERITPREEISAQVEVVEEPLSVQKKSVKVESSIAIDIGGEQPSIHTRYIRQPLSPSSKIARSYTPCEIEILIELPCSPGNFISLPADVVHISDQQKSQDLQGLERQSPSGESWPADQFPAANIADGSQHDIRINSPKDQHSIKTSLHEEEYSTSAQAIEKVENNILAEDACEVQINNDVAPEHLTVNEIVLIDLLRPTRHSATLSKKSTPRTERLKPDKLHSSEKLKTPTSSHSRSSWQNLSSILEPDGFEELQSSNQALVRPAFYVGTNDSSDKNKNLSLMAIENTKLNMTHTLLSVVSTKRPGIHSSSGIRSANESQASPIPRTSSGTIRRCGERGFRCTKRFCFKCIGD